MTFSMIIRISRLVAAVAFIGIGANVGHSEDLPKTEVQTSVCFTSQQGCAAYIVDAIDRAKHNIYMMQLFVSQREINDALIRAKRRGVNVSVILDRKDLGKLNSITCQGKKAYIGADQLAGAGIAVLTDNPANTAHNKVTVIDDDLVIGGSYNFSKSAERSNIENATFSWSKTYASWYLAEWHRRADVSQPYFKPPC